MSTSEGRTRRLAVAAAFGAGVIGAAHIGKMPPALPLLRAELGLDIVTAGWIVSVFSATGMVLGMLVGLGSDRFGHRAAVLAGMILMAAGSALGALAGDGAQLLAARFVEGLGFLVAVVAAPSVIAEATSAAGRRLATGMWGAFMPTGMGLALAGIPFVQDALGWRGAWAALAALTLLWAGFAAWAFRGAVPRAARAASWHNLVATVTARGPWLLALGFSFYTLAWLALMVWLPTFLVEERGLSLSTAALMTLAVVAVNLPGNLLGGWLLHKGVPRGAVIGAGGLAILIAGPFIFLDLLPDGARFATCLAYSCLAGVLPSGILGGAPYFAPSPRQIGTTNGLIVQGSHLGQFIGPPLVAMAVAMSGGWQGGALVFAVCGAGALVFAALIARTGSGR